MRTRPTQELAEFTAGLTYAAVPHHVLGYVKLLVLDALGCALAGHDGQETAAVAAAARALGGQGDRTVIGDRDGWSMAGAALLNGYLVSALTLNDVYTSAHTHLTPPVLGACLPMAESADTDGQTFLVAMAAGLEVGARVAVGIDYPSVRDRGWHSSGIVGPFAAAAAAGVAAGLGPVGQRRALGLAGSRSGGSLAARGTPTVKFHQADGALAGVVAVLLAEGGFESSQEILTDDAAGLLHLFAGGGNPSGMVRALGDDWELLNTSIRLRPGGTAHQPALGAIVDLQVDGEDLSFDSVAEVEVVVSPSSYRSYGDVVQPSGTFEALRSFNFLVASLLRNGELWLDHVGPSSYEDEEIRRFARERVVLIPDDALQGYRTRVRVTRQDGTVVSRDVDAAPGDPVRRASRDEVVRKFHRCARARLDDGGADRVVEAVAGLESLGAMASLTDHLRPADQEGS